MRARLMVFPLLFFACDGGSPADGEKGGDCLISLDGPCVEGLVCVAGVCKTPSDADGGVPTLDVDFTLQKRALQADGEDKMIVQINVVQRDSEEPWTGDMRVWSFPQGGDLLPERIELKDDGSGVMQFTACNGEEPDCPASTKLLVSSVEEPLLAVGQSAEIILVGGGQYGQTDDAGVVVEPGSDAGMGPVEPVSDQCRGGDNRVELRGGPLAFALARETKILAGDALNFAVSGGPDDLTLEASSGTTIVTRFRTVELGASIVAQAYQRAQKAGSESAGTAGLDVRVDGQGCGGSAIGQFRVRFVEFDENDALVRFGAEFVLSCGDMFDEARALQGCVSYTRPE